MPTHAEFMHINTNKLSYVHLQHVTCNKLSCNVCYQLVKFIATTAKLVYTLHTCAHLLLHLLTTIGHLPSSNFATPLSVFNLCNISLLYFTIYSIFSFLDRFLLRKSDTQSKEELPVYNYIFDRNNLTWGQYMRMSREGFHEPFDKALWWVWLHTIRSTRPKAVKQQKQKQSGCIVSNKCILIYIYIHMCSHLYVCVCKQNYLCIGSVVLMWAVTCWSSLY